VKHEEIVDDAHQSAFWTEFPGLGVVGRLRRAKPGHGARFSSAVDLEADLIVIGNKGARGAIFAFSFSAASLREVTAEGTVRMVYVVMTQTGDAPPGSP
jgi:hypothetical protein